MDPRLAANPPKRPRARRLPPEERRAQLLGCALSVFAEHGLGEARHAEIANQASVSVSTVFVYFPTREALVEAVLGEVARFILDEVVAPLQASPAPAPKIIRETALAFANSIDTHPDHARVWLDWSTAVRDRVWPRYLEFQGRILDAFARALERGQREGTLDPHLDVEDAAHLIVGSAHMIAQMKFTHRDPDRVEHFIDTLTRAALTRV